MPKPLMFELKAPSSFVPVTCRRCHVSDGIIKQSEVCRLLIDVSGERGKVTSLFPLEIVGCETLNSQLI